jgi:hypothetical protein
MSEVVLARRRVSEALAVKWTGENFYEVNRFTEGNFRFLLGSAEVYDYLHDTWIKVSVGDYIMRGPKREYYPNAGSNFDDPDGTWEILERF